MKAICVDDERSALEDTLAQCRQVSLLEETQGFTGAKDALKWLQGHPVDLALLDVNMPEMNGIALARQIKALNPATAVVFLTSHVEYAYEAFSVRASGYLLKPATVEALRAEAEHALELRAGRCARSSRIVVRTFGGFEVLVNGQSMTFERARSRELLALLVDRCGMGVSRAEAFATIWGDRVYDHAMQKQLDVYIRSLRKTLRSFDIEDIFELKRGVMRVLPDKFECDLYLFLRGDSDAITAFRGDYMPRYPWASATEADLDIKKQRL